jgi:hypothetical protein
MKIGDAFTSLVNQQSMITLSTEPVLWSRKQFKMSRSNLKAQLTPSRNTFSTSALTIRYLQKERTTSYTPRFASAPTSLEGTFSR